MTTQRNVIHKSNRTSQLLLAAVVLLGTATAAGAQATQVAATDARWAPWVGCWQASSRDAQAQGLAPSTALPVVCIIPTAGNATIDLVTVNGGTPNTERVDANGSRREVNRDGCTGWEVAEFSPDARRIYLKSEHQCTGNRSRTSTGIMSISPNGEWLDVQNVKVGTHNGVRVVHYGRVPVPNTLAPEMKATLDRRSTMETSIAMLAASDSVNVADVIEASKRVDPLAVQTWLAQRGQGFNMDRKKLTQLADAKVPSNVIDVMVALSYPQVFAVNLAQADGQVVFAAGNAQVNEDVVGDGPMVFMSWDPFYSSRYGYYNRYGYGNGLGYNGYYPGYWYQGPPVIVTQTNATVDVPNSDTRGRMVRGRGYTRPSGDGSSGSPRGSSSDGGSSSRGSSSGSSGGSSSSGGGSEPRTAKPRSP